MPISHDKAREIAERLRKGRAMDGLSQLLAPRPPAETPLPDRVPSPRAWTAEAHRERLAFLEGLGHTTDALSGEAPDPDPETLQGNIENFIGYTRIPTGLIGPLRMNGLHAQGDVYVPLATSEGALVASYDRGARLLSLSGGVAAVTSVEQVQRAPGFAFRSIAEAAHFAAWAVDQFDRFAEVSATRTSHGRLVDLATHVEANHVYLIFSLHPGDAAGQNMVTMCTAAICEDILERTPVTPEWWFLESNMSGDKKATVLSFLNTRGRNVMAECRIPRRLVEKGLHTTPEQMDRYWRMSFIGGVQTGSIGVSGHIANGLAALFLACGQDVACVSEASVGITRMEVTDDGDLYASLTLPNLIVGTVGGGTRLPTASESLRIMGCEGTGRASAFAEICCAVALAGEISIVGALCAGHFEGAHARLGRPPSKGAPPESASAKNAPSGDAPSADPASGASPSDGSSPGP
ncbi:MAG: 3-hydroxy-3-methylglutaryl-CoA reductase [Gemmatimonadales bacterium]|nr:MAG: 3-hydroxy-3-methylglutaryl-CoA reductase [Gemmatimonadales bacterium]